MTEIRIGTPRSRTQITPEGKFEEYYEVEFFLDDARYTVTIPAKQFTAKAAEEAVKARAAELLALKDKKLSLGKGS